MSTHINDNPEQEEEREERAYLISCRLEDTELIELTQP
jgi:hypothetical protein